MTVSVTDSIAAPVTQNVRVTVTDVDESSTPVFSTLFAPTETPALTATFDPTAYELGVRFSANTAGEVTELRYYRGVEDAGDTDTRTLNLWTGNGTNLGSVTVQSGPNDTGWQVGTLSTPIPIAAGTVYVASYGTTENYVATNRYFNTSHTGPTGILSAEANTNGVFAAGAPGAFPTQSYASTNYYVDVGFESGGSAAALLAIDEPLALPELDVA